MHVKHCHTHKNLQFLTYGTSKNKYQQKPKTSLQALNCAFNKYLAEYLFIT